MKSVLVYKNTVYVLSCAVIKRSKGVRAVNKLHNMNDHISAVVYSKWAKHVASLPFVRSLRDIGVATIITSALQGYLSKLTFPLTCPPSFFLY